MSKKNLSLSLDKYAFNSLSPPSIHNSTELLPLKPENVLQKYPQSEIDSCWDSLCINVIQNYQRGKGTFIKGFGTFTFKNSELNLEGTTNEIFRDKKLKKPVFIVSKELNTDLQPGEFNPVSGIRYYISKENKNINIVNLNYAEIAFSLSMTKDKVNSIIKYLLCHINDSIIKKKFKKKTMGAMGTLMLKNNILAVKFDENFEKNIEEKNRLLNNIKMRVSLERNLEGTKNLNLGNFPNLYKTSENLKSNNSLITQCEPSARNYLKNKFNITIKDSNYNNTLNNFSNSISTKRSFLTNKFFEQKNYPFKFINDEDINNKKVKNYSLEKSEENKAKDNPLFLLDNATLKNLSYLKGSLIKDAKELDLNKNGSISKEQAIFVLIKNMPELKYDLAQKIIEFYFITEQIDYMKLIALLIKGCKNSFLKKKGYFDFAKYLFKNTGITFPKNKNFNIKDVIKIQKNKKFEIMKKADKESKKLNELNELKDKELNQNKIDFDDEKPLFYEEQKHIEKNVKDLIFLSDLIPKLKIRFAISLDQNINTDELLRILKDYEIYYQKDDIIEILKFIEINNLEQFTLQEFIDKIHLCKIINKTNDLTQFSDILKQINDIVYMNGGKNFLFNNELNKKDTLDINTFIKIIKSKSSLDNNTIRNAFYYIVKTSRDMNMNDYIEFFEKKSKKKFYDEPYFINMMKKIILVISEKFMTCEEYFDRLLSYNESTKDKVISRINWVKYLQYEKFNFNAEELDYFFDWIDTKKDNVLDIDEFSQKYHYTIKPLTILKNIIHNNKLDIEDLAHRMGIDTPPLGAEKKIDYQNFLKHMKKLDYILPETFIRDIFNELKEKDMNGEYISSKKFLDVINYIQPPNKYKSFTKNYIDAVRARTTYEDLKKRFEIFDQDSLGTMTKLEYVKSMSKIFPEFSDDDHMRFIRIMDLLDLSTNKVIYPELLNLIFYSNEKKKNDNFTKVCEYLLDKLKNECDNDIEKLMCLIEDGKIKKTRLDQHKPLSIENFLNFFKRENITIDKKVIHKLDLDSDGLISYDDLYAILYRYKDTLYFKYYNNSNAANINLFTKDYLSKEKLRILVRKLLNYMKNKNITLYGLFKKFDKNDNGLVSNIDFNKALKKYLNIDAALADPFFAYLDFYNIGMFDFETFKARLTYVDEESSNLYENDRKEENEIIGKIKSFILKNKNLSDNEIFQIMDKDIDGIISPQDLILFAKENLDMAQNQISRNKIERVMMTLSLSKNLQVGFNDISEFIKLTNTQKKNIDLKEVFTLTSNQNLSQNKKNVDWINDIIGRLGMYVSEKYENIDEFFNDCVMKGCDKLKFEDFIKFHEKHYDLFNNGFHLTKDELLAVFTSLDSQKKNFLTKRDLENKLQYFNFYKKMHFDLKDFFQNNFFNGFDAFKYFFKNDNNEIKYFITIKQFFDAFENFFPNKYEYNTVLKYLNKYFHIDISPKKENSNNAEEKIEENKAIKDTIEFTEFNYIYFDQFESNEEFLKNYSKDMKLLNNHNSNEEKKTYYLSELFNKNKNKNLITPFDSNSLTKLIRIINSSKYDVDATFNSFIKENNNNPNINKFQFRALIKKFNIGLTNVEIDQILKELNGPVNLSLYDKININTLRNMIKNEKYSERYVGEENIKKKISEIKSLIYKFYGSSILCFQIIDINNSGKIDFIKYRNMLNELYIKNEQEIPNFALIKNTFDYIDLRKDGIIDYNEWNKAFAMVDGKLDLEFEKFTSDSNELNYVKKYKNEMRMWENSDDITQKYMIIYKNRKLIKNKLSDGNFIMNKYGKQLVPSDSLIYVIKKMLPNLKMSHIQWKILTDIGKIDTENLVNINNFFKLVEINAKKNSINNINIHTSSNEFNKIFYGRFDTLKSLNSININNNSDINKIMNSTSCGKQRYRNLKI